MDSRKKVPVGVWLETACTSILILESAPNLSVSLTGITLARLGFPQGPRVSESHGQLCCLMKHWIHLSHSQKLEVNILLLELQGDINNWNAWHSP